MVEQILRDYEKSLYCLAYKMVNHKETAQDLVQQTYLVLIEKFHTIRNMHDEKVIKAFAVVTLKRLCIDYLRKQNHTAPMPIIQIDEEEDGVQLIDLIPDESKSVEDTAILQLDIEKLREVVKLLSIRAHNYIVLKYYLQYNDEKIAMELEIQKDSVRTIGSRAKSKLKLLLEDQEVKS